MRLSVVFASVALLCSPARAGDPGPLPIEPASRDFKLTLGGATFDPLEGPPPLDPLWTAASTATKDLRLVQLAGPTQDAALERLRQRGLEPVQYIHPYTYVVWAEPAPLAGARTDAAVRWTGEFAPGYRVLPRWQKLGARVEELKVLIYRGADSETVIERIEAIGGEITGRRLLDVRFEHLTCRLAGDRLAQLARVPGVYSAKVQPVDGGLRSEMSNQVNANNVDGSNLAFPGYPAWLAGLGLDGSGVIMANVDSGVDASHPDLVGRMLGCSGTTCSGANSDHGTHTAGIMAADGASGELDGGGFLRGLGVAPGAQLFEQQYSPHFQAAGGMLQLMKDSRQNGAVISGNSWGPAGTPQGYDDDTLQTDIGVRDADPDIPGNQPLTYVLSFMNGYGGNQSQGSPDEAKNLFTIGSTKMQSSGGAQDTQIRDLSSNSAHGPALDGRTIPHLVAPGCYVDSTSFGAVDWALKCGTSMASPHVAGAAALFVERYRGLPETTGDPSPALVKAAFLAPAVSLAGNQDADGGLLGQPFDSKQGWGRMDLEAVIDPPPGSVQYFDQEVLFDQTGEEWSTTLSALDPALPVRVMLVWTDAPGHGLGGSTPAWNNDLDLVVEAEGNTYLGNHFGVDGFSKTGGTADPMNNTEGVFLPSAAGAITLRVLAANINSDGVPAVGDGTDQDFALACVNCVSNPGFTVVVDDPLREVCAPGSVSYAIEVGSLHGFSDSVTLSATGLPAGSSSSFSVNPVVPGSGSQLQLDPGAAATGDYTVTIAGLAGALQRQVDVSFKVRSAPPAAVLPLAPSGGAVGVALVPSLSWSADSEATDYVLELAIDAGFTEPVYSVATSDPLHTPAIALQPGRSHFWRVTAVNACGIGSTSAPSGFTTLAVPAILLVDDDDNDPDVRATYTDLLSALGRAHDVWDTANSDSEPTPLELAPYETVIWFSGDEFGGAAGPGAAGEAALADRLDRSACLLISSQDYFFDRDLTPFMTDRLGVAAVTGDASHTMAMGSGSVFGGLGSYLLTYPYTNYSDTLGPMAAAEAGFSGDMGVAAVNLDAGAYRTSYWGFGVEAISSPASREAAVGTFLQWCDDLAVVDGDTDGTLNGDDCAPADSTVWAAPSPATDLRLGDAGELTWTAPVAPGAGNVTYDVIRSDSPWSVGLTGTCIATDLAAQQAIDSADPPAGYFYLIRSRNDCGASLGNNTAGGRPGGAVCP